MIAIRILIPLVLLIGTAPFGLGQDYGEHENWIGEIEGGKIPYLKQRFKTYTKEDVATAKKKLKRIRENQIAKNSWEGTYDISGMLSETRLIWSAKYGFVNYYIYTCEPALRALNYGKVRETDGSLVLHSQKPKTRELGLDSKTTKFVKVKWGDFRYLVDEQYIKEFAVLASGHFGDMITVKRKWGKETVEQGEQLSTLAWVNINDRGSKRIFGQPQFPKKYKNLAKAPIESRIVSLGKTVNKKTHRTYNEEDIYQSVTIGVGSKHGVMKDMEFFVPEVNDRIIIEKVYRSTALGYILKYSNEYIENEKCNFRAEVTPCVNAKVGMRVKTIPGALLDN